MAETISYKNYSVTISLNERAIYLKIIDTINFLSYEGNIDLKELRIPVDLDAAYKVMLNSFKEEKDYSVCINANSGNLKIIFNALFAGFLKINFEVLLREKLMSNDGQLTLNFNKLEQKQAQAIDSLTKKCADLEGALAKQQQNFTEQLEFLKGVINGIDIFTDPWRRCVQCDGSQLDQPCRFHRWHRRRCLAGFADYRSRARRSLPSHSLPPARFALWFRLYRAGEFFDQGVVRWV